MGKSANSLFVVALLAATAALCMGIESCSNPEPKEYCKFYKSKTDQAECTTACEENKDFKSSPDHKNLIQVCRAGQLGFIQNPRHNAAEVILECDRQFKEKDQTELQKACRAGVAAEELRYLKSNGGSGSSNDRETGNNH